MISLYLYYILDVIIWEYTVDEEHTMRRISETYLLLMKLTFYEVWGRFERHIWHEHCRFYRIFKKHQMYIGWSAHYLGDKLRDPVSEAMTRQRKKLFI
jgi:hypothetical protein